MDKEEATTDPGDDTYREVLGVLDSGRPFWWQAERAVAIMAGGELIAGQKQDAGDDKPFDVSYREDRLRADVKTQQGNELDVKKEKPGKQFAAWISTGKRFVPLQLVLDSLSHGWYVVPGIPLRTADVVLDPTITSFDVRQLLRPFLIGRCLLPELRQRERYDVMVVKLLEALETVEQHREQIQTQVNQEHLKYIASTAENTLEDTSLRSAILGKLGNSEEAMRELGQSEEAMRHLGQSEEAMSKLSQSEEARSNLIKSLKKNPALWAEFLAQISKEKADDETA